MTIATSFFPGASQTDLAARAAMALAAGKIGSFEYFPETDHCIPDAMMCQVWGLPTTTRLGAEVYAQVLPEDLDDLYAAVAAALEKDQDYEATFRIRHPAGHIVWIGARGRVVERDAQGNARRMLGLNWDVTQSKVQEDRLTHLVREMNHRVNNAFALIDSMLALGRETASDLDSFADLMTAQVHALADAHQLVAQYFLHRPDAADRVPLSAVLDKVLRIWRMVLPPERLAVALHHDPDLNPQDIASLSMVLYELATNAAKYSVLGPRPGALHIEVCEAGRNHFRLTWREVLDTPRQDPPAERRSGAGGFGQVLMEHCLEKLSARAVVRNIDAAGLTFSAEIPAQAQPA